MKEGIKDITVKENEVGCWKNIKSSKPYTSALEQWESGFWQGKGMIRFTFQNDDLPLEYDIYCLRPSN